MQTPQATDKVSKRTKDNWLTVEGADFDAFKAQTSKVTDLANWPLAANVEKNILIYDGDAVRRAANTPDAQRALTAEFNAVFRYGPGVLVIKNAVEDKSVIDKASALFDEIIKQEKATSSGGADHFAKPGANDRIWNSLQKHCLADPQNYIGYYANAALALASTAWLGPGYQVTAQLNVVNPCGAAQSAHRDYHLGFMTTERALQYPAICHEISPFMTLQGGVAHGNMPIESGPTKLLPFSQNFMHGYAVYPTPEYQEYFEQHHVQLPMEKGDMLFFNPALMHAAGANKSETIRRMVNLFQISSAFGRALENVQRTTMTKAIYEPVQAMLKNGQIDKAHAQFAILATAEDYPFPTNLDTDPPVGGLVPQTHAVFMIEALEAEMPTDKFCEDLDAMNAKRGA